MTRRWTVLVLLVLFLVGLGLRLPGLGANLTPDERLWSQRTTQFLGALEARDWPATLVTGHPGVTVMWAGAGGVLLKKVLDPPEGMQSLSDLAAALAAEPNRLDFVAWLRLPIALLTLGGILLFFLLARRLFGGAVGALAAAFLLLDPFFLAHSRVLQMDALLTTGVTIAWLSLLVGTATRQRRFYLISGVAAGFGFLTKAPAVAIGPPILVLVALTAWKRSYDAGPRRLWSFLRTTVVDLLWFGLPTLAVITLFWPAMWAAPLGTLQRVWQFATALGGAGHELGNFWLGRPVDSPGALFYPAVLLWRTTAISLLGLGMALCLLLGFAFKRGRAAVPASAMPDGQCLPLLPDARSTAAAAVAVLGFAVWFAAFMTLGDKEFDRYLLPAFPAVDLLAAWGWLGALALLIRRWRWPADRSRVALIASAVLLVAVQALAVIVNRPTFFTAYNPLLGGIRTASRVMLVGWGEGLEEAAGFLNEHSGGQPRRAAAWYGQNVFGPFFRGQSFDLYYDTPKAADLYANDVDYVVTYINQRQRELLDRSISALLPAPVTTIARQGVALAQVYDWPKPFGHTANLEVAPGVRLLGWTVGEPHPATDALPVTLDWDADALGAAEGPPPAVHVWIKDAAGEVWATSRGTVSRGQDQVVPAWLDRQAVPQVLTLQLPTGLLAGTYRLEAAAEGGAGFSLGAVDQPPTQYQPGKSLAAGDSPAQALFDGSVELVGYHISQQEDGMVLDLLWAAQGDPPVGVEYFLHVTDGQDRIVAQSDGVLAALPGQTQAHWQQGDLVRQRLRLALPPGGQLADYRFYTGLYHPDTGARLAATANGQPLPDGRYLLPGVDR